MVCGGMCFEFDLIIKAGVDHEVELFFKAQRRGGVYTGEIDICEGRQYIT